MRIPAFTTALLLTGLLTGCGAPTPKKFVDGPVTQTLHPEAQKVVRAEVEQHFGNPANLVASFYFVDEKGEPIIDFGRIEGEVAPSSKGGPRDYQIEVELTSAENLSAEDIKGLGLLWLTGAYQEAETVPAKKGQPVTEAWFSAIDFRPTKPGYGILSLNYKLAQPPLQGDKFVLVGHRLRRGRSLYMRHCMHCHGYSGDGNGPTAKYLNPRPRDYRRGIFKFTSTSARSKASRDDLKRIVKQGIPGTYMPSFLLLKDEELRDIIEYVRWLAVRGEFEQTLAVALATDYSRAAWSRAEKNAARRYAEAVKNWEQQGRPPETKPDENTFSPAYQLQQYVAEYFEQDVETAITNLSRYWANAEKAAVVVRPKKKRPPATLASIRRGRELFLSRKANCWECHGSSAQGNGPQTVSYQPSLIPGSKGKNPEPGLYDIWGNKIRPRNLTTGIFRGGRRPLDIYRRIYAGIKGTPMQPFGTSLKDDEIWDLVNYVMAIPHLENGTFQPASPETAGKATAGPAEGHSKNGAHISSR